MKKKKHTKLYEWQLKAQSGHEKCRCGETRHLTVDHIVPAYLLEQFCLDREEILYEMEENFELLCRYCNHKKASRIDVKNPKTYEVLRAVLKKSEDYFLNSITK